MKFLGIASGGAVALDFSVKCIFASFGDGSLRRDCKFLRNVRLALNVGVDTCPGRRNLSSA
jgi:hypothetical protein